MSLVKQTSEFRWHFRVGFEPRVMAENQLTDDLAQKRVGRIDRKQFAVYLPNPPRGASPNAPNGQRFLVWVINWCAQGRLLKRTADHT